VASRFVVSKPLPRFVPSNFVFARIIVLTLGVRAGRGKPWSYGERVSPGRWRWASLLPPRVNQVKCARARFLPSLPVCLMKVHAVTTYPANSPVDSKPLPRFVPREIEFCWSRDSPGHPTDRLIEKSLTLPHPRPFSHKRRGENRWEIRFHLSREGLARNRFVDYKALLRFVPREIELCSAYPAFGSLATSELCRSRNAPFRRISRLPGLQRPVTLGATGNAFSPPPFGVGGERGEGCLCLIHKSLGVSFVSSPSASRVLPATPTVLHPSAPFIL
jgi:hypothetical protein